MKSKLFTIFMIVMLSGYNLVDAQGFHAPAEGKAAIYFVRTSPFGFGVSFDYFHNDKFIGVFNGVNYMRYECDQGENLIWAISENKEFVTANFKEGGTYIIMVTVTSGMMKMNVKLTPISSNDGTDLDEAIKLVNKKKPVITPQKKIDRINKKFAKKHIPKNLAYYEDKVSKGRRFSKITEDMAIAEGELE